MWGFGSRKEARDDNAFDWEIMILYEIGDLQEKYIWIGKKFNFRYAESAISAGPLDGFAQWAMKMLIWSSGRQSQICRNWSDSCKDEGLFSVNEIF